MEMEKVQHDLFECPVCFEIPEGHIFQCQQNGHTICDPCSRQVDRCPQCGDSFVGKPKLRNRTLESFIGGMEVDCKFKDKGCNVRMPRRDLAGHVERSCEFRSTFNFCKILGFPNCNFVGRTGKEMPLYHHFVAQHYTLKEKLEWKQHRNSRWVSNLASSLEHMRTSTENRMSFFPVEVKISSSQVKVKVVLAFITNIERGDYSVICLHFGKEAPVPVVDVKVEIRALKKRFRLSWTGEPTHFTKVERVLSNPPFTIRIPYLLEVLGGGGSGGGGGGEPELEAEVVFLDV